MARNGPPNMSIIPFRYLPRKKKNEVGEEKYLISLWKIYQF